MSMMTQKDLEALRGMKVRIVSTVSRMTNWETFAHESLPTNCRHSTRSGPTVKSPTFRSHVFAFTP